MDSDDSRKLLGAVHQFLAAESQGRALGHGVLGDLSYAVEGTVRRCFSECRDDPGGVSSDGFVVQAIEYQDEHVVLRGLMRLINQELVSCRAAFELDPSSAEVVGYQICYGSAFRGIPAPGSTVGAPVYKKPVRWLVQLTDGTVDVAWP